MSKWFKLAAAACGSLFILTGCPGGGTTTDKCASVMCSADKKCDPADGVCKVQTCSPACSGATPACRNGTCVQCIDDTTCSGATPLCDFTTYTCKSGTVTNPDGGPGTDSGQPDAGPPLVCAPKIVNVNAAGTQIGLAFSYVGSLQDAGNQMEPPLGCQGLLPDGGLPFGGPDTTHEYTMPIAGDFIVTSAAAGSEVDTVLYTVPTCVAGRADAGGVCNDDIDEADMQLQSTIIVPNLASGQKTTFIVDSYDYDSVGPGAFKYELNVFVRALVDAGVECDRELVTRRCFDGLSCSRMTKKCEPQTGPEISAFSVFTLDATHRRIAISGTDAQADATEVLVQALNAAGAVIASGRARPPILDKVSFEFAVDFNFASFAAETAQIRATLFDASDKAGASKTTSTTPLPIITDGGVCGPPFAGACPTSAYCKASDAGAETGSCVVATAPIFVNGSAYYSTGGAAPRVAFRVTDPDMDLDTVYVRYIRADGGVATLLDGGGTVDPVTPLFIEGSPIAGVATLLGPIENAALGRATSVEVTVEDSFGLKTTPATLPLTDLPIIDAGVACNPSGFDQSCASPTTCYGSSPTCLTPQSARAALCSAATAITLGTPVTATLPLGFSLYEVGCAPNARGTEKAYTFTTTVPTYIKFTADFPETTVPPVLWTSTMCGEAVTVTGCTNGRAEASRVWRVETGTHYLFVDSWRSQLQGGKVKFLLTAIPEIAAGGACDPLLVENRCAVNLRCSPNADYLTYSCK